jgi:excinuclease ABC subunit A
VLGQLVEAGNTVVVVEHDLDVIAAADWIVDLGPEAADGGGRVVVAGTPAEVMKAPGSHTGHYLAQHLEVIQSTESVPPSTRDSNARAG